MEVVKTSKVVVSVSVGGLIKCVRGYLKLQRKSYGFQVIALRGKLNKLSGVNGWSSFLRAGHTFFDNKGNYDHYTS